MARSKHLRIAALCLALLSAGPALRAQSPATAADSLMAQFRQVAGYDRRWTREQVFVHLDNNGYFEGETIWFSAYVVRASTLRPTDLSRVLYAELLNASGDVMVRRKLRIGDDGRAIGEFPLDSLTMHSGFYEVRAYTRAMLNWDAAAVFSRVVPVFRRPEGGRPDGELVMDNAYGADGAPSRRSRQADDATAAAAGRDGGVRAAFFPEGGRRIAGQPSTVAFRLTDRRGNPLAATCRAYDAAGRLVATASAVHEGMGSFTLPADAGAGHVEVDSEGRTSRFDLPAEATGYALAVDVASADTLGVTVAGGTGVARRLLGLAVTTRGRADYFDTLTVAAGDRCELRVPRAVMGGGVAQVTLTDASGAVVAERLVWNDPPPALGLTIRQSRASYDPCSPIALEMQLTDADGRPRRGSFSLAVRDRGGELVEAGSGIRESLLLASGVKGYVARPDYYFEAADDAHRRALDLLLAVQGWRCYDWQEMAGLTDKRLEQPVEEGILIDGRAVGSRVTKPLPDCHVDIDIFLADQRLKGESTTDSVGAFAFLSPSFFGDGIGNFYLSQRGKAKYGFVALNRNFVPAPRYLPAAERDLRPPRLTAAAAETATPLFEWTDTLPKASIMLSEAKVAAKGFDNYFYGRYTWGGGEKSGRIYSEVYYNIEDELERYMDEGNASPLVWDWLMKRNRDFYYSYGEDGFHPQYKGREVVILVDNAVPNTITPADIMADELKSLIIATDMQAYQRFVLPVRGPWPSDKPLPVVFMLYSDPLAGTYQYKKGRRITRIHGYSAPADFYHPDYRTTDVPTATDLRRTLYWNPAVTTDDEGRATAVFFGNSRDGLRLVFSAQGVTADGRFVDLER